MFREVVAKEGVSQSTEREKNPRYRLVRPKQTERECERREKQKEGKREVEPGERKKKTQTERSKEKEGELRGVEMVVEMEDRLSTKSSDFSDSSDDDCLEEPYQVLTLHYLNLFSLLYLFEWYLLTQKGMDEDWIVSSLLSRGVHSTLSHDEVLFSFFSAYLFFFLNKKFLGFGGQQQ